MEEWRYRLIAGIGFVTIAWLAWVQGSAIGRTGEPLGAARPWPGGSASCPFGFQAPAGSGA